MTEPTEPTAITPDGRAGNGKGQPRGQHGKFDKQPGSAARDAEAANLRARGKTYRAIGEHLGITTSAAHEAVKRAYLAVVQESAEEALKIELERLDLLQEKAMVLLGQEYVKFAGSGESMVELVDVAPNLTAIETLRKISESRRKLLGLDQPAKVALSGGVAYTLNGVDLEDVT